MPEVRREIVFLHQNTVYATNPPDVGVKAALFDLEEKWRSDDQMIGILEDAETQVVSEFWDRENYTVRSIAEAIEGRKMAPLALVIFTWY